jgi:LEA14-like dessication related protein
MPCPPGPQCRRRFVAALVAGACGLSGTACGALLPPANLVSPTISFSDLSIESASLDRVTLAVTVLAGNPNAIDLPLSDVRFELSLLGQSVAQGEVTEKRFRLPAKGSLALPLRFTVATADLRSMLLKLALGAPADSVWALQGTAHWGASPLPIPFERRGDADSIRRLLRERLGGIRG